MGEPAEKRIQNQVVQDLLELAKAMLADVVREAVRAELASNAANDQSALTPHVKAAARMGMSPNALHKRIQRGHIEPDKRAGEDGARSNMFSEATIQAVLKSKR